MITSKPANGTRTQDMNWLYRADRGSGKNFFGVRGAEFSRPRIFQAGSG
jgi:hypothetical protein